MIFLLYHSKQVYDFLYNNNNNNNDGGGVGVGGGE
jgi:hypothetical protein